MRASDRKVSCGAFKGPKINIAGRNEYVQHRHRPGVTSATYYISFKKKLNANMCTNIGSKQNDGCCRRRAIVVHESSTVMKLDHERKNIKRESRKLAENLHHNTTSSSSRRRVILYYEFSNNDEIMKEKRPREERRSHEKGLNVDSTRHLKYKQKSPPRETEYAALRDNPRDSTRLDSTSLIQGKELPPRLDSTRLEHSTHSTHV